MKWFRRYIMRRIGAALITAGILILKEEAKAMTQEGCKHEGEEGRTFCSKCGVQLVDEVEERFAQRMSRVVEEVLKKHGLVKEPKPPGEKQTLKDKIYGGKK